MGGMFSSFIVTFTNNYGSISNFGLSLSGFGLGWSWLTGTTAYTGNLSGTTYGSALYSYGLLNFYVDYALDWTVEPGSCTIYYSWRHI